MAATPYPIPRQLRQSDIFVGNDGATYSGFSFKIFDILDVEVWTKADGEDRFSPATVTVAKLADLPLDDFSVTFGAGQPATTKIVVRSSRLSERSVAISKGTLIDLTALEKELSKQASVLQELRRDSDRAMKVDFGETSLTIDEMPDGAVLMKEGDRLVQGPNATDIANAQPNAEAAAASAALAAKWADNGLLDVIPGKKSAWYWAQKALEWASAGVAGVVTFNARAGNVTPQAGDYSSAQVSRGGGTVETALVAIEGDVAAIEAQLLSGIEGLLLSNNGGAPNTHVDIGAGKANVGTLAVSNPATVTKRLNATWTAGSGNGGLDTGAVAASSTYFLYALRKNTDGTFDAVFSTSATIAGVNTTLLTGYTIVKCIGVVLTNASSNIRQFIMYPMDEYLWVTPVLEFNNVAIGTGGALGAITVPNGVKVKANLRFMYSSGATTAAALIHDPAQGNLVAGGGNSGSNAGTIQVASGFAVGADEIWTNTSKQVRYVAGASGQLNLWSDGFTFPCGRIA